tara:strand:+ start:186 stop:608 length:423 start_codon:yes stop_codon:yes gene_type:complete
MLARYRHNHKYNLIGGAPIEINPVTQPKSLNDSLNEMNAHKAKQANLTIAQNKLAGGARIEVPQVNSASPAQNKQLGDTAIMLAQGQTDAAGGGKKRKRSRRKRRKSRRKSKKRSRRKSRRKYHNKRKKRKRRTKKKRLY